MQEEIVVIARASDAAMAAKVETAIAKNPYILGDHVTVTVTDGVVRVAGLVRGEVSDLLAILRVARRAAGKARVVNEIEFQPIDDEGP
jgi:osmotically-inducible protein OsmY